LEQHDNMTRIPKFASSDEGARILKETLDNLNCAEVAVVRNPSYLYSPLELYPLPPKITAPLPRLAGIIKDMDGTTTTTEPLCLHSLEWMVRQVTGRMDPAVWAGFDHDRDYPHIIGNSTTKHVEYLLETYGGAFVPEECLKAYVETIAWTLSQGRDEGRKRAVRADAVALGLEGILEDGEMRRILESASYDATTVNRVADRLATEFLPRFQIETPTDRVRAMVDIYYTRYHVILADIADGKGARRAKEVLGAPGAHLVEPMPGIGVFLAALKGWLGEDLALFFEPLADHVLAKRPDLTEAGLAKLKPRLPALGRYLARSPVPVAVVTSSIVYESRIVLNEVFAILRDQIAGWPIGEEKKGAILRRFADPAVLYDAWITASDSSEIRLKPHRDLYSIALHEMGLGPEDFPFVVGFEDSESGVIAIRAAGVGLAVAVPFAATAGHDLSAAAHVVPGQIPETLLVHNCFLDPGLL
jgi:beta-phosphoglucomutase-like phosphatase (HAD superfamily)